MHFTFCNVNLTMWSHISMEISLMNLYTQKQNKLKQEYGTSCKFIALFCTLIAHYLVLRKGFLVKLPFFFCNSHMPNHSGFMPRRRAFKHRKAASQNQLGDNSDVGWSVCCTHHLPLHTYERIWLCDYLLTVVHTVDQLWPRYAASVVSHVAPQHNEGVLDLASEVMCEKCSCQSLVSLYFPVIVLIYLSFPAVTEKKVFHTDTCETHHFFYLQFVLL